MTTSSTPARSRLAPEPVPRRDVLGLASLWAAAAALLFGIVGALRLPKAAVLPSPSKKFKLILPDSAAAGVPFVPPGRAVAVFRDQEGVFAISTVCTHLGCVVKSVESGFECPCHGSRFAPDGAVSKGPAPRALDWLQIGGGGNAWTVDEGVTVKPGTKVKA